MGYSGSMKALILALAALVASPVSAFEADPSIVVARWYYDDMFNWVAFDVVGDIRDQGSNTAQCVAFDATGAPVAVALVMLASGNGVFTEAGAQAESIETIRCRRVSL